MRDYNTIAFVILHYQTIEDTIECISSIEDNIDTNDYEIIVVDNASPNDSGRLLEAKYKNNHRIHFVFNKENVGFARGMNAGIDYVKKEFQVKFMAFLNNDILLIEKELCKKLNEEWSLSGFHFLGPLVYSGDGRFDSNPLNHDLVDMTHVKRQIVAKRRELLLRKIHVWGVVVVYRFALGKAVAKSDYKKALDSLYRQEDVPLHGSVFFTTTKAIEEGFTLFDKTFMFGEERFLYLLAKERGWKTVYQPAIVFFHKEDSATNYMMKERKKVGMFKCREVIRSSELFLDYLRKHEQDH